MSSSLAVRITVTGTVDSSASEAESEPANQRATRPIDRRPTTICCALAPISSRAEVPEARNDVSLMCSLSMSMSCVAASTQVRSLSASFWRSSATSCSVCGSGPMSHEYDQPYTAFTDCPESTA